MKPTQWGIYQLPDGTEVYASEQHLCDGRGTTRWAFYQVTDNTPLLIENEQQRGTLWLMVLDDSQEWHKFTPCDLTFDDLTPNGKKY